MSRSLSSDETDNLSFRDHGPRDRIHHPDGSQPKYREEASLLDDEKDNDDDHPYLTKSPAPAYAHAPDAGFGTDLDAFPDRFSEVMPSRYTDSTDELRVDPSDEEFFLPCAVRAMESAGWTKLAVISREDMSSMIAEAGKAILEHAAAQAQAQAQTQG